LVLTVADTGWEFGEKPAVRLDRFGKPTALPAQVSGSGIGLALVKELVEVQGGKVDVQIRKAKGPFTVRLPYLKAEGADQYHRGDASVECPSPLP